MEALERRNRTSRNVGAHAFNLARRLAGLLLEHKLRVQVWLLRALGIVDFPVPPYSQMLAIGSRSIRHYYESGITCHLPIAVAALDAGLHLNSDIKILDFGCGVARQLQHFTKHYPTPHYHACDVNGPAIDFIRRQLPAVAAFRNDFRPPLPIDAGFFDMIYSVSVFTHLGPEDQRLWLQELARVTRPAGYCFLTTAGFTALRQMRRPELPADPEARCEQLAARGIIFHEYADRQARQEAERRPGRGGRYPGIEGVYGITAMSPTYITRRWPEFGFALEAILEGIIGYRQDLVVLRRT